MTIERQIHFYPSSPRRSIKRIIYPTDLSSESNHTLLYAVALARSYDANLYICHCVEKLPADGGGSLRENIKKLIENLAVSTDRLGLKWESLIVEGSPAQMIVQEALRLKADLIVIYPKKSYSAALLGSTTEIISRSAPCPVLVTHRGKRELVDSSAARVIIKNLLVAYDFSDQADWAFSYGLSLAQEYQARLHLLHVVPIYPENPYSTESMLERAMNKLKAAVPKDACSYCDIKQVVKEGRPYSEILTYAREREIDLICMGAHGADYGKMALFGSNADRVLRQSTCPVLIAHPFKWFSETMDKIGARKVLVATDGTSYGESVIRAAAARNWPEGTKLRVITVMEPLSKAASSASIYSLANEVREALEHVAASSASSLIGEGRVISHVVKEGTAAEEIVAEAKEWGADLILIGSHSRHGVSRFLLGSVAENVTLTAPCQVEIVREPEISPEMVKAMTRD